MKKVSEKVFIFIVYLFCFVALVELGVNYGAFYFLFPVKNATSYGYIAKKTARTVVPLNKYHSRVNSQLMLPIELLYYFTLGKKELKLSYSENLKKYGYLDKKNNISIDYKYSIAKEFENDFAIVAIEVEDKNKFGTIDVYGRWIVDPKYDSICPFSKYHTKACIDSEHCGVIDRFGNEITLMSYKTDKLQCESKDCLADLCKIGQKENEVSCNYFL